MTRRSRITAAFAALALLGVAVGPALAGAEAVATKGQFAVQMAQAAGLKLPATGTEQAAMAALAKAGIALGPSVTARVTEQDLVLAGKAVGAKVTTTNPTRLVTSGMSQAFAQTIKGSLQQSLATSTNAPGQSGQVHVSCQGATSRLGRQGTPASNADPNATATPADISGCGEEPIP
ncbi:MAG TPA: hypothetical protein VFT43_09505 [Candidatus Polarisedimenticolia bacterium]|nr:hypothetical protein [Candidatus Polarisedimenticolia bacterium]